MSGSEAETPAERQARLASERTMLAWWRTALASYAVGIGVGRFLPELAPEAVHWPYTVIGLVCGLYGLLLFVWGQKRMGGYARNIPTETRVLAWGGLLIGILVCGLILFE